MSSKNKQGKKLNENKTKMALISTIFMVISVLNLVFFVVGNRFSVLMIAIIFGFGSINVGVNAYQLNEKQKGNI